MGDVMSMIQVLAILPYKELTDMVRRAAESYPGLAADCFTGNLEEGLYTAKRELEKKKYDLILSRGGTAEILRTEIQSLSVIEIPISFEDIFYSVMLGRNYHEQFAVVSFPALTSQANSLCAMLDYDVEIRSIHSEQEALMQLENLQEQGYTMIIGDVITAQTARKLGLNVVLITSSLNSVHDVLKQICNLKPLIYKKEHQNEYVAAARKRMPCKLIILNDKKEIIYHDLEPEYCDRESLLHYLIKNLEMLTETKTKRRYLEMENCLFYLEIQKQRMEEKNVWFVYVLEIIYRNSAGNQNFSVFTDLNETDFSFQSSYGVTNSLGSAKNDVTECGKTNSPVLIVGEWGTGKDAAAKNIYLRNKKNKNVFFTVDCETTSEKEWGKIFNKNTSPLYNLDCTIYFKNVNALSANHMMHITEQIEQSNILTRNKLIFSETTVPGQELSAFSRYLLENVSCFLLRLLPVRERKDDLRNMLVIYINELNLEFGKRIVGFTDAARDLFLSYPWPGNVSQMKRVLRALVNAEQGIYITQENVEKHLRKEMVQQGGTPTYNINLNQTLEEINQDIVRIIMRQENMNQSKVAKRLNIGRTTLWRMLKRKDE